MVFVKCRCKQSTTEQYISFYYLQCCRLSCGPNVGILPCGNILYSSCRCDYGLSLYEI